MFDALFSLTVLASAVLFVWYLMKRGGFSEYPFLVSGLFFGWGLPQLYLVRDKSTIPLGAPDRLAFMTLAVLCAIVLGWQLEKRPQLKEHNSNFEPMRLKLSVSLLTVFGVAIQLGLSRMASEVRGPW